MNGADARTCQNRDRDLGDHRQIDGDPVALLDAERFHRVGKLAHLFIEFAIGDVLMVSGLVSLPDDRGLVAAGREMTVETIGRRVEGAVEIPFDMHIVRSIGNILDLAIGLDPVDPFALFAPEALRIVDRLLVHFQIFVVIDPGVLGNRVGYLEQRIVGHS